jgi:hypothetical protein
MSPASVILLTPESLLNPLTQLKVAHFDEAEKLFENSAIRFGRLGQEDLRRICSDAAQAMHSARPMLRNTYLTFEGVLGEWLGKLNSAKQAVEDEEERRRQGKIGAGTKEDSILWLADSGIE